MTNPIPSACGMCLEESDSGGSEECNDNSIAFACSVDDSIIADRFADISIIDQSIAGDVTHENKRALVSSSCVRATHIIVLVHGWMGNPAEMGYIRESIQNAAEANVATALSHRHRFVVHSAACNEDKTDDGIAVGGARLAQEINELVQHVVNGSVSDENDGENANSSEKITISIVGNSLGGLYARHALAGIEWDIGGSESSAPPRMLIPMVFVTTATPHLGISQHTYVPLPRAAEFVVAQGMKETGRDFFRFTPVLEDLFCKDYFLDPLSSFQQRIAYINVYGTDFQVPTATAAFWAPDSDSPHHRVKQPTIEEIDQDANSSFATDATDGLSAPKAIVMTLTTPRRLDILNEGEELGEEKKAEEGDDSKQKDSKAEAGGKDDKNNKNDSEDTFTSWSKRLDRLGWTKVLVDVREDVPDVRQSVAQAIDGSSSDGDETKDDDDENEVKSKSSSNSDSNQVEITNDEDNEPEMDSNDAVEVTYDETTGITDTEKIDGSADEGNDVDAVPDWTDKDTWTAGELLAEFKGGLLATKGKESRSSLWDLKRRSSLLDLKLPMGHTVMIANAKDEYNRKVTSGGKPVMDYLGASLIRTLQESVPSRSSSEDDLHEC